MSKTFTIQCTREVTTQEMAYWVITAFEGGINYWVNGATAVERTASGWQELTGGRYEAQMDGKCGPYANPEFWENPHHGYSILPEDDEPCERVLTANRLIAGIQAMVRDQRNEEVTRLITEQYDANDADTLLQYALFSEVVYG